MTDKIALYTFPSTKSEALTMLYLEKQDLSNLSPRELVEKYNEVNKEIKSSIKEIRKT